MRRLLSPAAAVKGPDGLSLRRWLAVYAAYLAALAAPAILLARGLDQPFRALLARPGDFTNLDHQVLKLLLFAIYTSLCTTFLPLPTGWLVAAVATRGAGLSDSLLVTALVVGLVGAGASTVANLHDYHVFTWMLRNRRIGRVRRTRLHERAAAWFARRPFALVVLFNVLPVPVDLVRMLAATCRYPLRPFAAGNFLGRFLRYAVLAGVTFLLGRRGWIAVVVLLATAVALGLGRLLWHALRRGAYTRPETHQAAPGPPARPKEPET